MASAWTRRILWWRCSRQRSPTSLRRRSWLRRKSQSSDPSWEHCCGSRQLAWMWWRMFRFFRARVTVATVKDLKQANEVLEKVRKFKDLGLHYRYFEGNDLRVVCIHDASSAAKGRNYAQEGLLVCLADDKFRHQQMDFETEYDDGNMVGGVGQHGGVMHVLHASGGKAKRVSYSTSHAETLSMVGGVEASTLVMIRLTEIDMVSSQPTIKELIKIQEQGNPKLPMDFYGDCADVWQLVTGSKTLPQDKGQRLYILSIKECRICGKMRQMVLIPTECMTADSLTKPMIHDSMLLLLSTGKVKFYNVENHPVKGRVLPALQDYDEHDIVKTDEEILQETKNDKVNLRICHSTILLGYFAMKSYMPLKFVAAASLMTVAQGMETTGMVSYDETVVKIQNDVNYTGVYVMIFFTVVIAVNFERFMQYVIKKVTMWRTTGTTSMKQEAGLQQVKKGERWSGRHGSGWKLSRPNHRGRQQENQDDEKETLHPRGRDRRLQDHDECARWCSKQHAGAAGRSEETKAELGKFLTNAFQRDREDEGGQADSKRWLWRLGEEVAKSDSRSQHGKPQRGEMEGEVHGPDREVRESPEASNYKPRQLDEDKHGDQQPQGPIERCAKRERRLEAAVGDGQSWEGDVGAREDWEDKQTVWPRFRSSRWTDLCTWWSNGVRSTKASWNPDDGEAEPPRPVQPAEWEVQQVAGGPGKRQSSSEGLCHEKWFVLSQRRMPTLAARHQQTEPDRVQPMSHLLRLKDRRLRWIVTPEDDRSEFF